MIKVPKQTCFNTGEEGEARKTIDNFFEETKNYITKSYPKKFHNFKIEYSESKEPPELSIEYLLWSDRLVAGVIETRTDLNNVLYTYFLSLDEVKRLSPKMSDI